MALTKKDQALIASLQARIAQLEAVAEKPAYPAPTPLPVPDHYKSGVTPGWWINHYRAEGFSGFDPGNAIGRGCNSSISHSLSSTVTTNSQRTTTLYGTRLEALQALRLHFTGAYAKNLAKLDAAIKAEEAKPTPLLEA